MEVTITRPIEEAIRTVPGLEDVRSVDQPRIRRDQPVLQLDRRHAGDAAAGRFRHLAGAEHAARTAQIQTHRLDFASFPIIGYSLTSDTVPQPSSGSWRPTRSSRG